METDSRHIHRSNSCLQYTRRVHHFLTQHTGSHIRSFSVQGAHPWISLPAKVRNHPSLSRHKTTLRGHLLDLETLVKWTTSSCWFTLCHPNYVIIFVSTYSLVWLVSASVRLYFYLFIILYKFVATIWQCECIYQSGMRISSQPRYIVCLKWKHL